MASNRESCRENEERDGLQNVEEAFTRYANTQIHGDNEAEGEAEGVGLGEKSRPRRLFDDLEARWARTLRTDNLIISFITHLNRELA